MPKKQIEVIDMHGQKTVAKKTSVITATKRVFTVFTVLWLLFIAWFPLYVKNHYAGPIKKSMVVSMFFDLQRNIVVIPGSSNPSHIKENTKIFDFELSADEMEQIKNLNRNEKHDWY